MLTRARAKRSTYTPPQVSASRPRRPYPNGWFAVAFSEEVPPGTVLRRRFMGEDVVIYRTAGGAVRVVEPYCPHLGAHLGYGGKVQGEEIVCPFHHFRFDASGVCVATSYGTVPPRARLRQWTCKEVNGAIAIWRHADGEPPSWELPAVPMEDFPKPVKHTATIIDHPQEVVENGVDIGHIGPVHHYRNLRIRTPLELEQHRLAIGPAAARVFPLLGEVDIIFDVEAHGLGYIWVIASIPRLRAQALFQAMATPIDPVHIDLRFTVSLRFGKRGSGKVRMALSRLLTVALGPAFRRDLSLDFPIWENKQFNEHPRLAKGDGPIIPFRRWAEQFYSQPPADADTLGATDEPARTPQAVG
jgi:nitrite reductase/ring-hydroxylating ferredoxin subunit